MPRRLSCATRSRQRQPARLRADPDRRGGRCVPPYLRLDAALWHGHETNALEPAARERLRDAGRLLAAADDGDGLVQQAAALLGGLVAEGALSEESAVLLWLDIAACAACAAVRRFTSRPAAEASIP